MHRDKINKQISGGSERADGHACGHEKRLTIKRHQRGGCVSTITKNGHKGNHKKKMG